MIPYIGEIKMFGGNFAPVGWALCNGQLLPISQYDALFVLIGTTYGGDGQTTFALPDLQGRIPIHTGNLAGNSFQIGEAAGTEMVTLATTQLPMHTPPVQAG
ncbi:MAG: tail fiber protein, partial [Anaerolineaceae bacterium]